MNLKIAIAEPSAIIRSGLEALLKKVPGFRLQLIEITTESFLDSLRKHKPDVLIINPAFLGLFTARQLREECGCPDMKCVALLSTVVDSHLLHPFNEQINLYDTVDEIRHKLERLGSAEISHVGEGDEEQQSLSLREKEIVVCVVKGMTNREIADRLFLSIHTVITHRRNIAQKLQIHSASGLTVYAIVNKLVELSDIKQ